MSSSISTILFDLDGTLFDTAPDIIDALNRVLTHHNRPTVELATLRSRINGGSIALLGHSFNIDEHHPEFEPLKTQLLSHYADIRDYKTTFFPGMDEVLNYLDLHGIPWGIVTNRLSYLAKPLLDHFGVSPRMQCLVGCDMVEKPKPDPASLLHAAQLINKNPSEILYLGDSLTDVQAAKAAGMTAMVASYGYIPCTEDMKNWQADYYLAEPIQLIDWLKRHSIS